MCCGITLALVMQNTVEVLYVYAETAKQIIVNVKHAPGSVLLNSVVMFDISVLNCLLIKSSHVWG